MSKKFSNAVPLLCSLCPKTPHFSDISHLLTHISSKSHLSHRFKLQIRSQSEPVARQQLDSFETWYAENGLEDLLSERMAAKDQKKTSKRVRSSNANIKKEPKMKAKPSSNNAQVHHAPPPKMHTWSNSIQQISEAPMIPQVENENVMYTTPTTKRHLPNFPQQDSISRRTRAALAKNITPVKESHEEEDEAFETFYYNEKVDRVSDTTRLKGIYWPGMDLFDSATTEMRRNRNQKKDGSVLQRMMLNSTEVEPNEMIFDADGDVYKIRSLYATSTDSSPMRSELDTPPAKKRRTRKALEDAHDDFKASTRYNSETPRKNGKKRKQKKAGYGEASKKDLMNPFGSFNENGYEPSPEEDEEFRMTVEDMGKQKSFGIFRDVSPGRTESPLEEANLEISNHGLPLQPCSTNRPSESSFHGLFKPIPVRPSEKESIQSQTGGRRTASATGAYPPQMFHDHSFNPLLFSHAHSFAYSEGGGMHRDENSYPFSTYHGDFKPLVNTSSARELPITSATRTYTQPLGNGTQYHM